MANRLFRRLVAGLAVLAVSIAAMPARAQDVVASPTTYDFFNVYIGRSATMTGSVTNLTDGTVPITSWEWTYNPLNAFQVTSEIAPYTWLGAGESADYQVTFRPPDFSFWNATLRFYTDLPSTPYVDVQFWGFGDFPPDVPTVAVWPVALDFGDVLMGEYSRQTTTINNIGGGELAINLTIAGPTEFDFTSGTATSFTLSGGEAQDVVLLFSPINIGVETADLVISHNDSSLTGDILVPLYGRGLYTPPDILVSPPRLDFRDVRMGRVGGTFVFITNTGGGELVVNVTIVGSTDFDFAPGTATSFTLNSRSSEGVLVQYSPSDIGDDIGDLVIVHNDPDLTDDVLVPLLGTGLPAAPSIDVSRTRLNFDSVPVGAEGTRNTTITNTGDGELVVNLTIAGSTDFDFAPGTPTSFTLGSGEAQDVVLRFSPSAIGDETADLVIEHNDPDRADDILARLSGTGTASPDCDVDTDGDVDRNDIVQIALTRNQPASGPDDPRDPDENGVINLYDVRICTMRCNLPGCAVL